MKNAIRQSAKKISRLREVLRLKVRRKTKQVEAVKIHYQINEKRAQPTHDETSTNHAAVPDAVNDMPIRGLD